MSESVSSCDGNLDDPRYLEALLDGSPTLAEMHKSSTGLDRKLRASMRQRVVPLEIARLILASVA